MVKHMKIKVKRKTYQRLEKIVDWLESIFVFILLAGTAYCLTRIFPLIDECNTLYDFDWIACIFYYGLGFILMMIFIHIVDK